MNTQMPARTATAAVHKYTAHIPYHSCLSVQLVDLPSNKTIFRVAEHSVHCTFANETLYWAVMLQTAIVQLGL